MPLVLGIALGVSMQQLRALRPILPSLSESLTDREAEASGVAGEFPRFGFGPVDLRLPEGRKKRIHLAACRQYSRWMCMVVMPDERGLPE
jgi:hypothetical protein